MRISSAVLLIARYYNPLWRMHLTFSQSLSRPTHLPVLRVRSLDWPSLRSKMYGNEAIVEDEFQPERQFQSSTPIKSYESQRGSSSGSSAGHTQSPYLYHHQQRQQQQQQQQQYRHEANNVTNANSHYTTTRHHSNQHQSTTAATASANKTYLSESPLRLRNQVEELQMSISQLALENEELKHELNQRMKELDELGQENSQLYETIQEKELVQAKMGKQLETVTKTAMVMYEKFRSFKIRYYEEQKQKAWLGSAADMDDK